VCVSAESRRNGALSAAVLPAFAPHPLESAEVLGPHAGEAVVLEGVADFVFTERWAPMLGSNRQNPAAHLNGRIPRRTHTRVQRLVACQVGSLLNVLLSTRIEYQGQCAWAIVTR
jgi:hypothetical protein